MVESTLQNIFGYACMKSKQKNTFLQESYILRS
jgi:hypothetical protein